MKLTTETVKKKRIPIFGGKKRGKTGKRGTIQLTIVDPSEKKKKKKNAKTGKNKKKGNGMFIDQSELDKLMVKDPYADVEMKDKESE